MINNFELLRPILQFDNPGDCYFVQILKRRKDNPGMERDMRVIDNVFFYSVEDAEKKMPQIISTCDHENARAYLRVNRRNTKKIAMMTLKKITDLLIMEDYKPVKNAYLSAAGEFNSEPKKRWIIDLDGHWPYFKIEELTTRLEAIRPIGPKKVTVITTKNGKHLISSPFDLATFKSVWPEYNGIDIHKDNPTILYIP